MGGKGNPQQKQERTGCAGEKVCGKAGNERRGTTESLLINRKQMLRDVSGFTLCPRLNFFSDFSKMWEIADMFYSEIYAAVLESYIL